MGERFHNDAIYVAVNEDVRESEKTLLWTLMHLQVNKIFLLHVHLPFSLTASSSGFEESEIYAIQESLVKDSYESLHKYREMCRKRGFKEEDVDISWISGYDVGEGIVELIYQHNIKKLVMGAAADPHYSRGMSITSRKAEYVSQHAPNCCQMWFICKGKLIKTRQGSFDLGNPRASFPQFSNTAQKPSEAMEEHENESPKEDSEWIPEPKEPPKKGSNGREEESTPSPPSEFICPIKLEIMEDPHVAADGFSYEAQVIRKWLRNGGLISPKTGQRLNNHSLTPNHTLRSLITDWLHQHPNYIVD